MSDTALAPAKVETPQPVESNIEAPKQGMESGMESGDASGVFRRAQADVDKTIASELAISKIDDPKAAKIASKELARLKQSDEAFQTKADEALKNLKARLPLADSQKQNEIQLRVNAVEAMKSGPLTTEELAKAVDEPEMKAETKPEVKQEVKSELSPEKQARLDVVNEELKHEETALHEFENTHSKAITKLEEAYLDALKSRVDALKFEQGAISDGREDQQTITDRRMQADKAEATYSKMYEEYLEQPEEEAHEEKAAVAPAEPPPVFEAPTQSYFQANPGEISAMPEQPKPPGRAGQAVGKFVDSLKFWKYFTRR